MISLVINSSSC